MPMPATSFRVWQAKALLNIKMDGYIEATVYAAKRLNLGLSEALFLSLLATLREFKAYMAWATRKPASCGIGLRLSAIPIPSPGNLRH